jgi:hypothetical protein
MSVDQILDDARQEFAASKKHLQRSIDLFFEDILAEYEESVQQGLKTTFDFKDIEKELRMAREELASLDTELKTEKYLVEAVKRVCSLDVGKFVLFYQERVRGSLGQGLVLPFEMRFSERDYPDMVAFLKAFLKPKQRVAGIAERERELDASKRRDVVLRLQNDEASQYFAKKIKHT